VGCVRGASNKNLLLKRIRIYLRVAAKFVAGVAIMHETTWEVFV
jgi:hypothetical protein